MCIREDATTPLQRWWLVCYSIIHVLACVIIFVSRFEFDRAALALTISDVGFQANAGSTVCQGGIFKQNM